MKSLPSAAQLFNKIREKVIPANDYIAALRLKTFNQIREKLVSGSGYIVDPLLTQGIRVRKKNNFFIDANWRASGVTEQFIGNADLYHERYFNRLDFINLADHYFGLADVDRQRPLRYLDIGSGSGSSVFAAANLLPNASIVASDISPQLLDLLADFVASRDELRGRITTYCFDLHVPFFKANHFDLIAGAAILHHLVDPYKALKNISSSLKPGGKLILIEPLETGSLVLISMFAQVIKVLQDLGQDQGDLAKLMRAMRLDVQARLGVPVIKPWTRRLDDKWVFDEPYLTSLAQQLHLSRVDVHPAQTDLANIYEKSFRGILSDSGNGNIVVPEEVLKTIQEFDQGISVGLKRKMCPSGVIVFTK
jgi:ubiquinone/menaquinone biosynthesis C-methylase UbiE